MVDEAVARERAAADKLTRALRRACALMWVEIAAFESGVEAKAKANMDVAHLRAEIFRYVETLRFSSPPFQ